MEEIKDTVQFNRETIVLLKIKQILSDKILLYILFGFIFSYFYNLPVVKYSIKGDNEFRLYDVLGPFVLYFYYKYYQFIDAVIRKVFIFKLLRLFLYWSSATILISLFFYIVNDGLVSFLQVILYMYHFWIFYIAAVFFYVFCLNKKTHKVGMYIILLCSILSCIIVSLQNMAVIDFLWNNEYRKAYDGFLSGTLGPNKIVLGMTCLFSFTLSLGILLEKHLSVNKLVLYTCLILNLYIIIISGSRTTYVGLAVLLLYFAIRSPFRFVTITSFLSFIIVATLSLNPELYKSLEDTLEKRIFSKTDVGENKDAEVGELYSDLGSGRDKLAIGNALYLLENPQFIPFGAGFMNRFDKAPGLSAHNMYIQVIKETGLVGFFFYFGWLVSFLFVKFDKYRGFSLALNGLVLSMLVTLFFGEHLYIYRPLFGILGLFLMITSIFVAALHKIDMRELNLRNKSPKNE